MKRGDAKSVTQISCPVCKLGQAVNRKEAHPVFTSYKYIRMRKKRKKLNSKSFPTVGRNTNLEAALLDPASEELFNLAPKPRKANPIDWVMDHAWLRYVFLILLSIPSIWLTFWLSEEGFEEDMSRFSGKMLLYLMMAGLWPIWYWLDAILEKLESAEIKQWLQEERMTWVCSRCHQTFLWDDSKLNSRKR
ncbi:MAG TPA: hypothetical protein VFZ34_29010 [Blastocatellia bacterium]|nr:hypothetical protein [Blastocatellia bacterium]